MRGLRAVLALAACSVAFAETGYDAWLRYSPPDPGARPLYARLPATVFATGNSVVMEAARQELVRGVRGMLGRTLREEARLPDEDAIVLATYDALPAIAADIQIPSERMEGSYFLRALTRHGHRLVVVAGPDERGVLYGTFALLRHMALHGELENLDEQDAPYAPVRWTNEWNNLDGSIERGYAGRSIFFDNGHVAADLTRARDYARLLASVGVNGCMVSNVNANPHMLTSEFIAELARLAAAFRPWGVRMAISVDFGSPKTIGGLDTFDPLDPRVIAWWKQKMDELYAAIPGPGRGRAEGGFRRARGTVHVRPHARRRRQRDCARFEATWRASVLPRVRLQPPHGLAGFEE